jgi:hypothetical protein
MDVREKWAQLGLNQRPLACKASALPLSYAPGPAGSAAEHGTLPGYRPGAPANGRGAQSARLARMAATACSVAQSHPA